MRSPCVLLAFVAAMLATPLAGVSQSAPAPPDRQPPVTWVPQAFETLGQRAAFHTDFTFDRSMLQLAVYFIGDADQETRNAIAKLNSITVHSYHFAGPGLYDPSSLDMIRRQYEASGWKHLVAAHGKGDPFNPGQTDLWINVSHMDVTGMMVLISASKDLNLIALNGDISTLDLLHLRGHFGIPRFSGDRFTPGREPAGRPPYVSPNAQAAPEQAMPESAPEQYPGTSGGGMGVGVGAGAPQVEAAPPPANAAGHLAGTARYQH